MTLLYSGLAIWWAAHLFKGVLPGPRRALGAAVGDGAVKGVAALLLVGSIVLMVLGYQAAFEDPDLAFYYTPQSWGWHVNNLLMVFAVLMLGAGHGKGRLKQIIRHPMLWAVTLWAAAHLLVRGDEASVTLFGGIGLWALLSMVVLSVRDGKWERPTGGTMAGDIKLVVIGVVVYGVIVMLHWKAFGIRPFPG